MVPSTVYCDPVRMDGLVDIEGKQTLALVTEIELKRQYLTSQPEPFSGPKSALQPFGRSAPIGRAADNSIRTDPPSGQPRLPRTPREHDADQEKSR